MSKNAKRGDQKTQAYIRNQAVKAVVAKGQKPAVVADVFGVALNTVYKWVRMYKSSGSSALKDNKRGCHKGSRSSLSPEQCKKIKKLITDKNPEQLKMPFVLWTRKAVQELIQDQFSIGMPIRTVGEYLNRWGFTPQKPIKSLMNSNLKKFKSGLIMNTPRLNRMQSKKVPRFIGVMKQDVPIKYLMDVAMLQKDRLRH